MLQRLARTTCRLRLASVLIAAAVLFCGVVSKEAHSLTGHDHAPVHHGVTANHQHSHDQGHSHDDAGDETGDATGGIGATVGHVHFDVFSTPAVHFSRLISKSRLEPARLPAVRRAWRWHFERPPKRA